MKLHDVIRTRRQTLGLTQEELARRLGVSAPPRSTNGNAPSTIRTSPCCPPWPECWVWI